MTVIWSTKAKVLLALALLVVASGAMASKARLGFGTQVSVSGFFSPTLEKIKVTTVTAGSPAAAAGLKPGDYIVAVDGKPVSGAPARAMASQFKNLQPGQHVLLKLERGHAVVNADLVAGA
ncbi:MAG: PDZ domain-containing protein [Rhodanobacter sp.]